MGCAKPCKICQEQQHKPLGKACTELDVYGSRMMASLITPCGWRPATLERYHWRAIDTVLVARGNEDRHCSRATSTVLVS